MAECSLPHKKVTDDDLLSILKEARTVAVVGVSHKEERDSHRVAKYLQEKGYQVIPVNPKYKEVLGVPCYADLRSVPEHIDVVDIFRNVEAIPAIVDEAIEVKAGCVWMQLGLAHKEAGEKARCEGMKVVMDHCIKIEHSRLMK